MLHDDIILLYRDGTVQYDPVDLLFFKWHDMGTQYSVISNCIVRSSVATQSSIFNSLQHIVIVVYVILLQEANECRIFHKTNSTRYLYPHEWKKNIPRRVCSNHIIIRRYK